MPPCNKMYDEPIADGPQEKGFYYPRTKYPDCLMSLGKIVILHNPLSVAITAPLGNDRRLLHWVCSCQLGGFYSSTSNGPRKITVMTSMCI